MSVVQIKRKCEIIYGTIINLMKTTDYYWEIYISVYYIDMEYLPLIKEYNVTDGRLDYYPCKIDIKRLDSKNAKNIRVYIDAVIFEEFLFCMKML